MIGTRCNVFFFFFFFFFFLNRDIHTKTEGKVREVDTSINQKIFLNQPLTMREFLFT